MSHTVLLIQPGGVESRTFSDFDTVEQCIEGVCNIYEKHLEQLNSDNSTITYTMQELFEFMDQLNDIVCLVYEKSTNSYCPCPKQWIKKKMYEFFEDSAVRQN
ncbi:enhancer of rudimentary homolog isoform X2 [Teleopsis dalmanni]|uniref:enhancer of rudimentary homolog isoform X2 n=1 Tax=Teleopsis dalmanni TaxID=139649 RepID=UPI0018CED174|nr:enhancer of rudimentary homolog isoform X2 [Teleopsis dalmanni]